MRYKNDKKYQICHHQIHFIKLKMHQNPFSDPAGGAYDAPPDPLVGWGGGVPIPHSPPRSARRLWRGVSNSAPRFSGLLNTILATPVARLGLRTNNLMT